MATDKSPSLFERLRISNEKLEGLEGLEISSDIEINDLTSSNLISLLLSLNSQDRDNVIKKYNINPIIIKDFMEQQNFSNNIQKALEELKINKISDNLSNSPKPLATNPVNPFLDEAERARRAEYVKRVLEGLSSTKNPATSGTSSASASSTGFSEANKLENSNLQRVDNSRAEQIYSNIFDNQISGSKDAKLEIEKKLLQTLEQKFGLDSSKLMSDEPSAELTKILQDAFKAENEKNPKLAEIKMLVESIGQVNEKIIQLEIKKQDQRSKQQIIKILEESEEMIAYQLHQERRMRNMVIVVPVEKAQTINELFGNAGISSSSQIEEKNPTNLQQPSNNTSQDSQPQVEVVEKVMVIEVHSPQEQYAVLSSSQSDKSGPRIPQNTQLTGNNVASIQDSRPVVGRYTQAVVLARTTSEADRGLSQKSLIK